MPFPDRAPETYRYALVMAREVQFDVAGPPPVFTTYEESGDSVPVTFGGRDVFMAFIQSEPARNALCQRGWRDVTAEYQAEADARTFGPPRRAAELRAAVLRALRTAGEAGLTAQAIRKSLGNDPAPTLTLLLKEERIAVEGAHYRLVPEPPASDLDADHGGAVAIGDSAGAEA